MPCAFAASLKNGMWNWEYSGMKKLLMFVHSKKLLHNGAGIEKLSVPPYGIFRQPWPSGVKECVIECYSQHRTRQLGCRRCWVRLPGLPIVMLTQAPVRQVTAACVGTKDRKVKTKRGRMIQQHNPLCSEESGKGKKRKQHRVRSLLAVFVVCPAVHSWATQPCVFLCYRCCSSLVGQKSYFC